MLHDTYLDDAIYIAKEAGKYLKDHFNKPHQIQTKSHINDLVTECDKASETMIQSYLLSRYPDSSFLCEESGKSASEGNLKWIIDPLDGTVNFAKKIPFFCVSIALVKNQTLEVGVIYSPMTEELFFAKRGHGAFLNSQKLHVSNQHDFKKAFGATGFPYLVHKNVEASLKPIRALLSLGIPLRRLGSAALDLCYVASSRFDLFFEAHLEPWDFAAGLLIIKEAHGEVTTYQGEPLDLDKSSSVLASNKHLHTLMLKEVML